MYLVGMELRGPEIMGSSLRGGDGPGNIVEINTWVHFHCLCKEEMSLFIARQLTWSNIRGVERLRHLGERR